jgi:hypothetical protein
MVGFEKRRMSLAVPAVSRALVVRKVRALLFVGLQRLLEPEMLAPLQMAGQLYD